MRGLFPRIEHQPVLAVLEQSVVFLTPGSIEGLIRGEGFLSTAWQLANIYLAGIGAETLGDQMRGIQPDPGNREEAGRPSGAGRNPARAATSV